ncbi:hypothetical protein [Paenibacillus sp. 1P03SA]|uniref:hypothetical protein n=1 Tax=Paenibacillus sp. 1P03SA TaxID=3132294 RepID=UPI0039A3CA6F
MDIFELLDKLDEYLPKQQGESHRDIRLSREDVMGDKVLKVRITIYTNMEHGGYSIYKLLEPIEDMVNPYDYIDYQMMEMCWKIKEDFKKLSL